VRDGGWARPGRKRIAGGLCGGEFLNDLDPFDKINPSAENIAKYFYDQVSGGLNSSNGAKVSQVKLWETDITCATYRP
jgi:6-pyruvoyltetrahydropterin/6-carboxytetrahydropterin synthase